MIRATRGRSMDGEVLIIGKVVGWSGWVPKGLISVDARFGPRLFFWSFFWNAFFSDFFRCWVDFGRFWEVKTEAKIDFFDVFFVFFSSAFRDRIFAVFWGLRTLKIVLSPQREHDFHKIDVFEKGVKKH